MRLLGSELSLLERIFNEVIRSSRTPVHWKGEDGPSTLGPSENQEVVTSPSVAKLAGHPGYTEEACTLPSEVALKFGSGSGVIVGGNMGCWVGTGAGWIAIWLIFSRADFKSCSLLASW